MKATVDSQKLDDAAELLRAVTHPIRMSILSFIDSNEKINVNKIYNTLNLEQSITSQHLKILRSAGVVTTERDGKFIYYSINYSRVGQTVNSLNAFFSKNGATT